MPDDQKSTNEPTHISQDASTVGDLKTCEIPDGEWFLIYDRRKVFLLVVSSILVMPHMSSREEMEKTKESNK